MGIMKQLLGQHIKNVLPLEWQSCTIYFDVSHLNIRNPIVFQGNESLEAFAGHYVVEVRERENREFLMVFEDGSRISISLHEEDFSGPEGMVYYGKDNLIVVWQLGDGCDYHWVYEAGSIREIIH
jgi:hypothetical protein